MRRLNVQIEPTRAGNHPPDELSAYVRAAADGSVLEFRGEDHGDDQGPYINLSFAAADHAAGWSRLRQLLDNSEIGRAIAGSAIIVCEGKRAWDDYLLLHHFDPDVELDDVG